MDCPFCQQEETKVTDSRYVREVNQVRRRRECLSCGERFTTYEIAELILPRVIKKDGSRVSFDEQKVRQGLLRALEKRPVSSDQIDSAMAHILKAIRVISDKEIASAQIGELVMNELKHLDEVAYVRFASVYRHFQDLETFQAEIQNILNKPLKHS